MLGKLEADESVSWTKLHEPEINFTEELGEIDWSIVVSPERHPSLQTILLKPSKSVVQKETAAGGEKPPLIVFPHSNS